LKEVIFQINPDSSSKGILSFCETRWVERHDALVRLYEHIVPVYKTLSMLSEKGDNQAEVLKNSFADSDFIIGLTCVLLTTATFKQLSECLQKPEIDLVTACEMVADSLSVLKKKRANAEDVYAKAFNEAVDKDLNTHRVLPEQVSYHKIMHSF
jgi:hypothetical protein